MVSSREPGALAVLSGEPFVQHFRSFFLKGNQVAGEGPGIDKAERHNLPLIALRLLDAAATFDGIEIWEGNRRMAMVMADHWRPEAYDPVALP